ncbi:MAG: ABC transporter ATP-binding protein [Bacteroidetes bacterium]|nr:MAG: ABC transporter ATP-binding protein [Bacteroidota bacterium]
MIIEAKQISKIFNKNQNNEVRAFENLDLNIPKGSCTLIKGSSGSGKSTLLAILSCLMKPTSGQYFCCGEQVSRWSEKFLTQFRQKHIGIIFQHFHLIKGLDVFTNISLPLLPIFPKKQIEKAVLEAIDKVNISHRQNFNIDSLSGGELQRTAIARALVADPDILFADEPTSHLDSANSLLMLDIFQKLKAEGKTILITSHDSLVENHPIIDSVLSLSK